MALETPTPTPTVAPTPTPESGQGQQSRPPHAFIGTAIIGGSPAPDGTRIVAIVDGVEVAETFVTNDGEFSPLVVVGNPGRTVTFRIGSLTARESFELETGGLDAITLTAAR